VPEWGDLPSAQLLMLQMTGEGRMRNLLLQVPHG